MYIVVPNTQLNGCEIITPLWGLVLAPHPTPSGFAYVITVVLGTNLVR